MIHTRNNSISINVLGHSPFTHFKKCKSSVSTDDYDKCGIIHTSIPILSSSINYIICKFTASTFTTFLVCICSQEYIPGVYRPEYIPGVHRQDYIPGVYRQEYMYISGVHVHVHSQT